MSQKETNGTGINVPHFDGSGSVRQSPLASRQDGWANVLTGLGNATRDKRMSGYFARGVRLQQQELEDMYHDDDIAARIVEFIPTEMVREWIEVPGDEDGVIIAALEDIKARSSLLQAMIWGRLDGGGVVIMGADDRQPMDQPLREDDVRRFEWLTVLDRWDLQITKYYSDPMAPKYGEPEIYTITASSVTLGDGKSYGAQVHESRVLRFDGVLTKKRRMIENSGWSESVLQRSYEIVRDFSAAYQGTANMLQDFSQAVFKIKNLSNMLASDQDELILKRLSLIDQARSIARAIPLDADGESFNREATPTAGLPDLLDRMGTRLSASCGIPITILLGESPGGMNATGDSDHRTFYNAIKSARESILRPAIARLIKLIVIARGLTDLADEETGEVAFTMRPLWQQTDAEIADTRLKVAQMDSIYLSTGVLDAAEVSVSRFGGDHYSMETMIDNEEREAQESQASSSDLETKPDDALAVDAGTALNGAQVAAMVDIVTKVASNLLPRDSGIAILVSAFPVDQAGAEKIMGSAGKSFKIEQPVDNG